MVTHGYGGYRRLPRGSAHFSLKTHTHFIIIYISPPFLPVKVDKRERQCEIKRSQLVRAGAALSRLKSDHHVDEA